MAPLPKRRHTRSRTGKRRANKKLLLPNLSTCPSCKKFKLPHVVCPHCGFYGRAVSKPELTLRARRLATQR